MSKKVRRGAWTVDETFLLIDTIAELNIIRKIDGCKGRNQKYYRRVADEFSRRNMGKDWVQISTKWKNLKSHYYLHLKDTLASGQEAQVAWPFYEKLNNIMWERPRTKAVRRRFGGGDSMDPLLDSISEEASIDSPELSDNDETAVAREESMSPSPNYEHELEEPSSTSADEQDKRRQARQRSIKGTESEEPSGTCVPNFGRGTASEDDSLNTVLRAIADSSEWRPEEADSDKLFLMSLHASVRSLSDENNLQFRLGVMNLLLQLKDGD